MIIYELRQPRKVCTSPFAVWPGSRTSCFITLQTSSYFNVSIFPIIIIIIYFSLSLYWIIFQIFEYIYIYIVFKKWSSWLEELSPFQEFSFFHLHRLIIVLNEEKNVIRLPLNFIFLRGQQNPLFLPSIEFIESWKRIFLRENIYTSRSWKPWQTIQSDPLEKPAKYQNFNYPSPSSSSTTTLRSHEKNKTERATVCPTLFIQSLNPSR